MRDRTFFSTTKQAPSSSPANLTVSLDKAALAGMALPGELSGTILLNGAATRQTLLELRLAAYNSGLETFNTYQTVPKKSIFTHRPLSQSPDTLFCIFILLSPPYLPGRSLLQKFRQ